MQYIKNKTNSLKKKKSNVQIKSKFIEQTNLFLFFYKKYFLPHLFMTFCIFTLIITINNLDFYLKFYRYETINNNFKELKYINDRTILNSFKWEFNNNFNILNTIDYININNVIKIKNSMVDIIGDNGCNTKKPCINIRNNSKTINDFINIISILENSVISNYDFVFLRYFNNDFQYFNLKNFESKLNLKLNNYNLETLCSNCFNFLKENEKFRIQRSELFSNVFKNNINLMEFCFKDKNNGNICMTFNINKYFNEKYIFNESLLILINNRFNLNEILLYIYKQDNEYIFNNNTINSSVMSKINIFKNEVLDKKSTNNIYYNKNLKLNNDISLILYSSSWKSNVTNDFEIIKNNLFSLNFIMLIVSLFSYLILEILIFLNKRQKIAEIYNFIKKYRDLLHNRNIKSIQNIVNIFTIEELNELSIEISNYFKIIEFIERINDKSLDNIAVLKFSKKFENNLSLETKLYLNKFLYKYYSKYYYEDNKFEEITPEKTIENLKNAKKSLISVYKLLQKKKQDMSSNFTSSKFDYNKIFIEQFILFKKLLIINNKINLGHEENLIFYERQINKYKIIRLNDFDYIRIKFIHIDLLINCKKIKQALLIVEKIEELIDKLINNKSDLAYLVEQKYLLVYFNQNLFYYKALCFLHKNNKNKSLYYLLKVLEFGEFYNIKLRQLALTKLIQIYHDFKLLDEITFLNNYNSFLCRKTKEIVLLIDQSFKLINFFDITKKICKLISFYSNLSDIVYFYSFSKLTYDNGNIIKRKYINFEKNEDYNKKIDIRIDEIFIKIRNRIKMNDNRLISTVLLKILECLINNKSNKFNPFGKYICIFLYGKQINENEENNLIKEVNKILKGQTIQNKENSRIEKLLSENFINIIFFVNDIDEIKKEKIFRLLTYAARSLFINLKSIKFENIGYIENQLKEFLI